MKKLNFQKLFCFISFLFILSCCIYYGTRFLKLYIENNKTEELEKNSLVKVVRENNQDNQYFEIVNGENYFTNKADTNYLEYSNILFRIIKINSDTSITVISDHSLSALAYGKNLSYKESSLYKWLNTTTEEYSGILEKSLHDPETYLQKTESCYDSLPEISNTPCKKTDKDNYITLLSVKDYLNAGSKDSYLNNNEYYYLSNNNEDEAKVWYVPSDGKANLSNGDDIYGIRPVITIKANIDYISGDGTKDNPYKIEKDNGLFGSYVKLDNDIWRIYQVNDNEVRLMLNNYLQINGTNLTYQYSGKNSYFDDYSRNSIAYYLNHNYLNSLSYKDKIKEVSWSNGYYNSKTEYDYTYSFKDTINSKVTMMSIGNIFLNSELTNYYTMTGTAEKSSSVYMIQNDYNIYTKQVSQKLNIVPTISLDKSLLTKGTGTKDSPYEME